MAFEDSHKSSKEICDKDFPRIADLELISALGQGGMASVYKARQLTLDRIVAVKILNKNMVAGDNGLQRFQSEAKLSSSLKHPNIVEIFSFGETESGQPFIVMEYLEGKNLTQEIDQNAPLTFRKFQSIFIPLLSALEHSHQAGIIHRDIKPGNIFLAERDGKTFVKLLDFGIARAFISNEQQNLTRTNEVVGSPAFMSPEQCQGKELDGRSDIYSLSCVMYTALTGRAPFQGDSNLDLMMKHTEEKLPSSVELSRQLEIPPELSKLLLWGLEKDPTKRPNAAAIFQKKLNTVLNEITLDRSPKLKNDPIKKNNLIIPLGILGTLICSLFIFMAVQKQQRDASQNTSIQQKQATHERAEQLMESAHRALDRGKPQSALIYARQALDSIAKKQIKSKEEAQEAVSILKGAARIYSELDGSKYTADSNTLRMIMENSSSYWDKKDSHEVTEAVLRIASSGGNLSNHLQDLNYYYATSAFVHKDKVKANLLAVELRKNLPRIGTISQRLTCEIHLRMVNVVFMISEKKIKQAQQELKNIEQEVERDRNKLNEDQLIIIYTIVSRLEYILGNLENGDKYIDQILHLTEKSSDPIMAFSPTRFAIETYLGGKNFSKAEQIYNKLRKVIPPEYPNQAHQNIMNELRNSMNKVESGQ